MMWTVPGSLMNVQRHSKQCVSSHIRKEKKEMEADRPIVFTGQSDMGSCVGSEPITLCRDEVN
jgi:hypothetical protein